MAPFRICQHDRVPGIVERHVLPAVFDTRLSNTEINDNDVGSSRHSDNNHRWMIHDATFTQPTRYRDEDEGRSHLVHQNLLLRLYCQTHKETRIVHIDLMQGLVHWIDPMNALSTEDSHRIPLFQWMVTPQQLQLLFLEPLLAPFSVEK